MLVATTVKKEVGEDLRSPYYHIGCYGLRPRARKGKAPLAVPAGAVSPVFRAKAEFSRRERQARADARILRAPSGG